jgi:hypothetical protein
MKKTTIILGALLMLSLGSAETLAQGSPFGKRRTSFLSFGQKKLMFEAPLGLCFLDESNEQQAKAFHAIKSVMESDGKGTVMAIFSDCFRLESLGQSSTSGGPSDIGAVIWMNPMIGEKTALGRSDYLAFREKDFGAHIQSQLTGYSSAMVDEKPQKTDASLSIGYIATADQEFQKIVTTGVVSATEIEGVPIDFIMTHTSAEAYPGKDIMHKTMQKFTEQQIILNDILQ